MNIAYLVIAHAQPRHLDRMLKSLVTRNSHAFVHIDAKSDIQAFNAIKRSGVTLCVPRVPVYWGEFSQVEATLALLRQALNSMHHYDYCVLLSGADYPLCPPEYIESFFERHRGTEFINLVEMPSERASKPLSRLTDYQVPSGHSWSLPLKALRRGMKLLHLLGPRNYRQALGTLRPYAGSQWWALSRSACEHVLDFVKRQPRVVEFYRHSWFSDEMFFQTIIGNSPFLTNVRRSVMYTDWSAGGAHPGAFTERHLQHFAMQPVQALDVYGVGEALFARKFSERDAELLDQLDLLIGIKRRRLLVQPMADDEALASSA